MSFFVVKNRIHLTKGDSAEFDLTIRDRVTGSVFILGDGDRLTFTLKRFITDKEPVLTKTLGQDTFGRNKTAVFWYSYQKIQDIYPVVGISMK